MMDFPASPTVGQSFAPGNGTQYVWDGVAWTAFNQSSPAFISDTPPVNPAVGQMWWRGTNGKFYMWVDDGNSKQWVEIGNAGATPGIWEPIRTLDFVALGAIGSGIEVKDLDAFATLRFQADFDTGMVSMVVSGNNGASYYTAGTDYIRTEIAMTQLPTIGIAGGAVQQSSFTFSTVAPAAGHVISSSLVLTRFNKVARSQGTGQWSSNNSTVGNALVVVGLRFDSAVALNALKFYGSSSPNGKVIIEGVRG